MCIVISQECKNIIVIQIKKHEKYHLLFFDDIHIFFLSCTGWKDKKNMESDIITVNLDERDEISTKDLFSEIQLIPLETTPESLIRNITQIKFLRIDIIFTIIRDPKSLFSIGRDISNSRLTRKETARVSI